MGSKKRVFLKIFFAPNHFLSVPRWPGTLKNPKLALYTPQLTPFGPILCAFWANLGSKNTFFSKKYFFPPNHFSSVSRWSETLTNRKLPLYTPQWSPNDIYWVPRWSGTHKKPKELVFYTPPIWAPPVARHPARSRKELSPIPTLVPK